MNDQFTNTLNSVPAFNLSDFEARDTAILEIQNIKGDGPLLVNGQPVRVEVRSPGTSEALNAQHKIDTAASAKAFAAVRGKAVKDTVESKFSERADKLAAVTARIENFPVQALDLYKNPKLGWFTEQVAQFHADWSHF